jgi:predicted CDP-diglyceride synthetase/phosphatidate cytidylyltransferase
MATYWKVTYVCVSNHAYVVIPVNLSALTVGMFEYCIIFSPVETFKGPLPSLLLVLGGSTFLRNIGSTAHLHMMSPKTGSASPDATVVP